MKPLNKLWVLCLSAVVFAAVGCSKNDGGNADTTSAPMATPTPAPGDTAPAPAEPSSAPVPDTAPPAETTPPPAETPPKN